MEGNTIFDYKRGDQRYLEELHEKGRKPIEIEYRYLVWDAIWSLSHENPQGARKEQVIQTFIRELPNVSSEHVVTLTTERSKRTTCERILAEMVAHDLIVRHEKIAPPPRKPGNPKYVYYTIPPEFMIHRKVIREGQYPAAYQRVQSAYNDLYGRVGWLENFLARVQRETGLPIWTCFLQYYRDSTGDDYPELANIDGWFRNSPVKHQIGSSHPRLGIGGLLGGAALPPIDLSSLKPRAAPPPPGDPESP